MANLSEGVGIRASRRACHVLWFMAERCRGGAMKVKEMIFPGTPPGTSSRSQEPDSDASEAEPMEIDLTLEDDEMAEQDDVVFAE